MAIGQKLKDAQAAGTLTDRQQNRINFLQAKQAKQRKNGGALNKVDPAIRGKIRGEIQANQVSANAQTKAQNATYNSYTGGSNVTFDANGNPVYNETLSDPQQNILNQGQQLTQTGQQLAQGQLNNWQGFNPSEFADRQRMEDAAFKSLTRFADQDFNKEKADLEQTLYNRGIPLDPTNPAYKNAMDELNRKYNGIKEGAALSAVQLGGQEQRAAYEMGLTTHQQNLSDIGTLQQQGSGFIAPNTPGFQAPNWNVNNPTDVGIAMDQLKQGWAQINNQKAAQQGSLALQQQALAQQQQQSTGPVFN